MVASHILVQSSHSNSLDDELAALTFQHEELGLFRDARRGKRPIDHPSDADVAFATFQAELEDYQSFLRDQMLAQSIGAAVHSDGLLIGDLTSRNLQTQEDRRIALDISTNDPEIEAPPPNPPVRQEGIEKWSSTIAESYAVTSIVEFYDDESEAGPSMTYTGRQADILEKFSTELLCTACYDRFPRASMAFLACNDHYCASCISALFIRSTRDEGLYPPKCCCQPIPLELVARHMEQNKSPHSK